MFIERIWQDGKKELFNLDAGTVLRMHEGYYACWYLEVDANAKVYTLLRNTAISIIQQQYNTIKQQWVGDKTVVTIEEKEE